MLLSHLKITLFVTVHRSVISWRPGNLINLVVSLQLHVDNYEAAIELWKLTPQTARCTQLRVATSENCHPTRVVSRRIHQTVGQVNRSHYDRLKQQMIHDRLSKLSKQTPFSVLVRIQGKSRWSVGVRGKMVRATARSRRSRISISQLAVVRWRCPAEVRRRIMGWPALQNGPVSTLGQSEPDAQLGNGTGRSLSVTIGPYRWHRGGDPVVNEQHGGYGAIRWLVGHPSGVTS